jgi:hypothetical protein
VGSRCGPSVRRCGGPLRDGPIRDRAAPDATAAAASASVAARACTRARLDAATAAPKGTFAVVVAEQLSAGGGGELTKPRAFAAPPHKRDGTRHRRRPRRRQKRFGLDQAPPVDGAGAPRPLVMAPLGVIFLGWLVHQRLNSGSKRTS